MMWATSVVRRMLVVVVAMTITLGGCETDGHYIKTRSASTMRDVVGGTGDEEPGVIVMSE